MPTINAVGTPVTTAQTDPGPAASALDSSTALRSQNAALDAYNVAMRDMVLAQQKLDNIGQRPSDIQIGQDGKPVLDNAGRPLASPDGKEWDKNYAAATAAVAAAKQQGAAASRQYGTILQQQSKSQATTDPATAAKNQADADWLIAKAGEYAATSEAERKKWADQADAALTRARAAAGRVDAQNNASNASATASNAAATHSLALADQVSQETPSKIAANQAAADNAGATAAETRALTPVKVAQGQAAADETRALTPVKVAEGQAAVGVSNATADKATADADLVRLQQQMLVEHDPLIRQQLQSQIDEIQSRIDQGKKPTIEPGFAQAAQIPTVVKDKDGNWTVNWVPNQGQAMTQASALQELGKQLGANLGTGEGQIPLETAKELVNMAWQTYTAQTARQTADTAQQQANTQGATAGASILNDRATQTSNLIDKTMSAGTSSKNYGLGSTANVTGLPQAALNFTTAMGGGQSTYDTAAAMIHKANPALQGTPAGAGYAAVLQQVNDQLAKANNPQPAAPQPVPAPAGPVTLNGPRSGQGAPQTTIAPDGTITIQHVTGTPGQRGQLDPVQGATY